LDAEPHECRCGSWLGVHCRHGSAAWRGHRSQNHGHIDESSGCASNASVPFAARRGRGRLSGTGPEWAVSLTTPERNPMLCPEKGVWPMRLWRDAKLRTKVGTGLLVATIGLAGFALTLVLGKQADVHAAEQVVTVTTLSTKVGDLLHETQRERGRTAQFTSSHGSKFGP